MGKIELIIKIMGLHPNYTFIEAEKLADNMFKLTGGF